MRAGGRPKSLKSGARWVSAARGGGRRKAATKETVKEKAIYDSDGDGKTDFLGWVYYAPTPECPAWFARAVVLFFLGYICLKYS